MSNNMARWFAVWGVAIAGGAVLYAFFFAAGRGTVAMHQAGLSLLVPLVTIGLSIWSENRRRDSRARDESPSDHVDYFLWRVERPTRRRRLSGTAIGLGLITVLFGVVTVLAAWMVYKGQSTVAGTVLTVLVIQATRVFLKWLDLSKTPPV